MKTSLLLWLHSQSPAGCGFNLSVVISVAELEAIELWETFLLHTCSPTHLYANYILHVFTI